MRKLNYKLLFVLSIMAMIMLISCNQKQKQLERVVSEMNVKCPMMLDGITRLDKCEALSDLTIKYTCTIIDDSIEFDGDLVKKSLIESFKSNSEIDKNLGITYVCSYYDEQGNLLLNVDVTPEDYNN